MMPVNEKHISDKSDVPDETTGIMVYGHLKIVDLDTGEILINKRA